MKFNIYKDLGGLYRWRLLADNGRIMADSSEGYAEAQNVKDAIQRIVGDIENKNYLVDEQYRRTVPNPTRPDPGLTERAPR